MNWLRLLSLVILASAVGVFTYIQRSGIDPMARQCLTASEDAIPLCQSAYAKEGLTNAERGFVAFRLGYLHDVAGDWKPAIDYYTISIDLYPQKTSAFMNRGLLLRRHGVDLDAAVKDFSSYLASGQDDVASLTQRARTYREMDQLALAAADIDWAIAIDPQNPHLLREHAELLQDQKDDAAALIVLDRAIAIYPGDLRFWRERSWVKRKLADYEGAMSDIIHVIATDPEQMWPWFQRGWLNVRLHNYEQALTDLQTALAKDPDYAPAQREMRQFMRNVLGHLHSQPHRLTAVANAGLVNDPDNLDLIYLRVLGQRGEGKFIGALNDINRIIAASEHPQTLIFLRSAIHLSAGQYDQALADLEDLTRDPSQHTQSMQQIAAEAASLRLQGKDAEAAARDSDLGDLATLYAEAMRARVAIHRALENWEDVLQAFEELAAYDPDDSSHWTERGKVLVRLDRPLDAIESYTKAIQLIETFATELGNNDGSLASALLNRGAVYQSQRRAQLAQADFAAAMKLGNTDLIRAFQQKMQQANHYTGSLNGIIDTATETALQACAADPDC